MGATMAGATGRRVREWGAHPLDVLAVAGWMAVAEVGVRLVDLPRLARWMGAPLATGPGAPAPCLPALRPSERRRVRLAGAVGRRWPFADGPCLRQALVTGRALRRHRPVLRIGASLAGAEVTGHAWLEVGSLEIGRAETYGALLASPSP
ncbi:MAG: lasso peptide biosynthesis B2 protein [Acidobacteriota bacterium]|nr:lasso peptide biosynthesis B2 protein [Acidobacteriota bacterium]